jgi:7,8-dihydropterin-6-yl-methyl-4-(beta-D-ribofuranosyl)aminobenzene 5'-phosphate synthase
MSAPRIAFVRANARRPPVRGNFGVLDRQALENANLTVTYSEGLSLVADHGFTTGQIGLTSFENLLSPSAMKIGVDHGLGCYANRLPEDERTKTAVPDQFRHEIPTAFNLKGRGLVVLTSCSHRGVVNTIKQAQAASGVKKVHAVIGGIHLAPYKEDYLRETIAALNDIDIHYVIPLHCSGEPFYECAKARCRANYYAPTLEPASSLLPDPPALTKPSPQRHPPVHRSLLDLLAGRWRKNGVGTV